MASIWFNKEIKIADFEHYANKTLQELIGIEWQEVGDNFLKASMPVDDRTRQPYGLLHGGASCVLAETIGSMASALVIDSSKFACVGLEINANHVRSAMEGRVIATATPLHLGSSTHVWDIKIHNEANQLLCISRLTVAIIPQKSSFRNTSL